MGPIGIYFQNTNVMKHLFTATFCFLSSFATFAQVGIGTVSPNSMLDVRGSFSAITRSFTGSTNLTAMDYTLVFNGSSATSATLPDAGTCSGRIYCIKNFSTTLPASVLTVGTVSSQKIDGSAVWILDEPNETLTIISDGANWEVFNQNVPVARTSGTGGGWNEGGNSVTGTKAMGTNSGFDLPFVTNNTERMRITSAGNVGIGTSTPAYALQVNAAANPLSLGGVQTGLNTDSILTISNGVVRKLLPSSLTTSSANAWSLLGNAGTISGTNFLGTTDNTSLTFRTNNIPHAVLDSTGNLGIGTGITFNAIAPEKLLVNAGTTTSFNAVVAKGSVNNYFQLNINNQNAGANASSDVVATADNGNEIINFVDLGINSSANTSGVMGNADDAYLYTTGNNLVMGTANPGMAVIFLTGGTTEATNERMRITGTGNVGINTTVPTSTLQITGSFGTSVTTKTISASIASTDFTTLCNNTAGAITLVLPNAAGIGGRIYIIKKISGSGNNVTIDGFGTQTIDGSLTFVMTNQYSTIMIQSDSANWNIISQN
jgi:hypothetical protein